MKDYSDTDKWDQSIEAVKKDLPTEQEIGAASERVRAAISAQRGPQSVVSSGSEMSAPAETWNSLEDYIAAIPAYLAKQLTPAQTLLFEEESRQSIPLRRELDKARGIGATHAELSNDQASTRYGWLAAAATVAAIGIAMLLALPQLPSFDQSQLAQVDEIEGQVNQIVDGRLENLTAGT